MSSYKPFVALPPQNEEERAELAKYQASNPSQLAAITEPTRYYDNPLLFRFDILDTKLSQIEEKIDTILTRLGG